MPGLNDTPSANRIRIAFFGLRNAGKSTLVNAFAGQDVALVSDVAGTTTDPVSKAMEILPLGPCLVTDTAGLDDVGELGEKRVARTLEILSVTDVAVWVVSPGDESWRARFAAACEANRTVAVDYRREDGVENLKRRIAALKITDDAPALLDGAARPGEILACVCPIDESAPKGRLILPQVQVLREALDRHLAAFACQPRELAATLGALGSRDILVVTDSQAFGEVAKILDGIGNPRIRLTSFSVLFARQKGDLDVYLRGVDAVRGLRDGDTVLVAEGCTHHRQCNDIGTTKIPKAIGKLSGAKLKFRFASGGDFDLATEDGGRVSLVVQCGGCMLSRREVLRRIAVARAAGVPIANYGLVLAAAAGVDLRRVTA